MAEHGIGYRWLDLLDCPLRAAVSDTLDTLPRGLLQQHYASYALLTDTHVVVARYLHFSQQLPGVNCMQQDVPNCLYARINPPLRYTYCTRTATRTLPGYLPFTHPAYLPLTVGYS